MELGITGAAGLASVETLDDVVTEKNPISNEDGMETVRLDGDAPDGIESPKQHFLVACISAARRNLFALGTKLRFGFESLYFKFKMLRNFNYVNLNNVSN